MPTEDADIDIKVVLAQQLATLPKPVRNAITSADVEKELRELAEKHKLHLDQWEALESNVLMALLGLRPIEKLQENIKNDTGVRDDVALALVTDIALIVFEPIREELERELDNPRAKEEALTDVEKVGQKILAQEKSSPVSPATPPQMPPDEKAVRAPISEAYKAGEPSTARTSIEDDPYREPPA